MIINLDVYDEQIKEEKKEIKYRNNHIYKEDTINLVGKEIDKIVQLIIASLQIDKNLLDR